MSDKTITTKLYVIERHGVYRHGTVGISDQLDRAIEIAKEAARAERDDYHDFLIEEHVSECLSNGKLIATIIRKKEEISVEMEP